MTCRAGAEDMGDTPVMSALSDNGMHKLQKQQREQCRNMSCRQARDARSRGA